MELVEALYNDFKITATVEKALRQALEAELAGEASFGTESVALARR